METRTSGSERGAEETMVRNHHTGASASTLRDTVPSQEDRLMTSRLVSAGKLLGINVVDHIIIGREGTYFSFADEGLLDAA
jgi:DNA repair protein RadC